jgi:hypothetical protein
VNVHDRSTTDDAFHEWLLSDHPEARAERDYRRRASYEYERGQAAAVLAWVDKINALAEVPQTMRELADSMGPLADKSAQHAEIAFAEPDDLYVARLRDDFENYMLVSGKSAANDYRYPEHLTGPAAASYPPPPEPEIDSIEPGG